MRISKARVSHLYEAIHDPITDLRIALKFTPDVDAKVAQLEHAIWQRIQKALGIAQVRAARREET